MRSRELGIITGSLPTGKLNKITDVPGVKVGHSTVIDEKHQTGVTVIIPCEENLYTHRLPCAAFVENGYGKSAGLLQIEELGTLETPIAMTGTLNTGKIFDALVGHMIDLNKKEGVVFKSVNPVVLECNDGTLNYFEDRICDEKNLEEAFANACEDFEEGCVGSGRGMGCHGLKGGIGSSSRIVEFDGKKYTVGILTMTNHALLPDLIINGDRIGQRIQDKINAEIIPDRGSCIQVLATDLPLSDRQLKRVLKRCIVGMSRLGSYIGHGSGEVFVGFSTVNKFDTTDPSAIRNFECFNEDKIDIVFRACAEAVEESILNAMFQAEEVRNGTSGNKKRALSEFWGKV